MKQLSYAERLNQSSDSKFSEELQHKVTESSLQLQQDILLTSKDLSQAKRQLEAAKSAFPLNAQAIVDAEVEVENYEDGLDRLNRYYEELFGKVEDNTPVSAPKRKTRSDAGKSKAASTTTTAE